MTTLPPDADDPGFAEPPFTWADSDLEAALAVLGEAAVPPAEVLVLTDEEIVALDGLQHSQVVPTPWFDTQEVEPAVLAAIALRGLTARRLVRLNHLEDDDGAATPIAPWPGTRPSSSVAAAMSTTVAERTRVRPIRSPSGPKTRPPRGRMTKAAANAPRV